VRSKLHPDAQAAIDQLRDALEPVLDSTIEVRATPGGGLRAVIEFGSLDEALATADRLRRGVPSFDQQGEIAASRITP
jgi:hypothetical protein